MTTILSSVPYFAGLPTDDLLVVEQAAVSRTFQPGQMVLTEDDAAGGLYILESGWLKVFKLSLSGREQVLNFLGPGEVFNGVAVFTDAVNPASVVALEESKVWCIGRETMQELLDTHPRLARQIIRVLAGRLQHLVALVEDLSLRSVESRLARALLEETIDSAVPRRKWATQTEMAARLGTVPDVLNRALRKLVEEGVIEVTRHQIRIVNPQKLRGKIDSE